MSVFAEFLFDRSIETVPCTSCQNDEEEEDDVSQSNNSHAHNNISNNEDDEQTAASTASTANHNDNNMSADSEYGQLMEVMVTGLLEAQQQQQEGNNEAGDDATSYFSGGTILSSAPSEATIGLDPHRGQNRVARVPSSAALSLSTAPSCFLNVDDDDDATSVATALSYQASLVDSSISFRTSWSHPTGYQLGGTMDIGDADIMDPRRPAPTTTTSQAVVLRNNDVSRTDVSRNGVTWYAHFTDADWEAFRRRSQMIVKSLFTIRPTRDLRSLQLPPPPPALLTHNSLPHDKTDAMDLPRCFTCPLCQDVIVGAMTLDCSCQTNVCAACWEYHCVAQRGAWQQLAREHDFVIVPSATTTTSKQSCCPCCHEDVQDPLPCHALDVAISQLMGQQQHAPQWNSYVQRITQWRQELVRRQQENNETPLLEQRMAQLIQEEETVWKQRRHAQQRLPGFLGMAVAVAASVGIKLLMAQTVRAIQNNNRRF